MSALGQAIVNALAWFLGLLYEPLQWVLDGIVYVALSLPYAILDGLLTVVTTFVSSLDFSAVVFQWSAGYALIPPSAVYVMTAIGFPQFVTLIGAAYVVRMLLNLIPAALTRV